MRLFGTSGIRRQVDFGLVQLALQTGMAAGSIYPEVVIARDTRTSGSALRHALTAGLLSAGARCSDAGVMPTPTLAYLTREFSAGIMITASHNPPRYNGLKLLNPDGSAFSSEQQARIEDLINAGPGMKAAWEKMTAAEEYSGGNEKHIARIAGDFPTRINVRVVVDGCCGAAFKITPQLLSALGCEVIPLNCQANGFFPHDAEPVEANLGQLMNVVKETGADLGIAHDGDADRMMAVDELGRFVSGDKMLAILGRDLGAKELVTTIDASMAIEEMDFNVRRTKVGDPYVSEELKNGGEFGGEPSGAWVFPAVSLCPDGIYAAARIACVAAHQKLSALADSLPSYPVIRGSLEGTLSSPDNLREQMIAHFKPVTWNNIDGMKINLKDGWILVRPSGTEPRIRLTVEARDAALAGDYYRESMELMRQNVQGTKR
jgi:phosphoglucosamine mutase